jgi:hypothetical protein
VAKTDAEVLEALKDLRDARLTGRPVDEYSHLGTDVKYMPLSDLTDMIERYEAKVARGDRGIVRFVDVGD